MNDKQKFKDWLKENYSCVECNKEFFLFQKTDEKDEIKFIFWWQNKTWDPESDSVDVFLDIGMTKVCLKLEFVKTETSLKYNLISYKQDKKPVLSFFCLEEWIRIFLNFRNKFSINLKTQYDLKDCRRRKFWGKKGNCWKHAIKNTTDFKILLGSPELLLNE